MAHAPWRGGGKFPQVLSGLRKHEIAKPAESVGGFFVGGDFLKLFGAKMRVKLDFRCGKVRRKKIKISEKKVTQTDAQRGNNYKAVQ